MNLETARRSSWYMHWMEEIFWYVVVVVSLMLDLRIQTAFLESRQGFPKYSTPLRWLWGSRLFAALRVGLFVGRQGGI